MLIRNKSKSLDHEATKKEENQLRLPQNHSEQNWNRCIMGNMEGYMGEGGVHHFVY